MANRIGGDSSAVPRAMPARHSSGEKRRPSHSFRRSGSPRARSPASSDSRATTQQGGGSRGGHFVGVGLDALTNLLVGALHLRVLLVDVRTGEPEQLLLIGALDAMSAGTIDGQHLSSILGVGPSQYRPRFVSS